VYCALAAARHNLTARPVEAALLASYIQAGYTASEGYAEILRRLQAALAEAK
jgi:hypothetical protein